MSVLAIACLRRGLFTVSFCHPRLLSGHQASRASLVPASRLPTGALRLQMPVLSPCPANAWVLKTQTGPHTGVTSALIHRVISPALNLFSTSEEPDFTLSPAD